jgi:hypothetical protein
LPHIGYLLTQVVHAFNGVAGIDAIVLGGQVACGVQDEYTIANEEAFLIFREG